MVKTKTKTKEVNIGGGYTLPVNTEYTGEHTPKSVRYIGDDKTLWALATAIKLKMPMLIIGETGTGKTTAIRYLASITNNGFRRLNLNGSTTVDEFVGKTLIDEKGTYWVNGILIDAMKNGEWILLDEINAALPEILFVLHSLLDDDGFVVLSEHNNEIVKPHPNFRIFATCNPSESYTGTKELNTALLSRFVAINSDFPTKGDELKILRANMGKGKGKVNKDIAEKMIAFGNELRDMFKKDDMSFVFSPRELIYWYKLYEISNDLVNSAELAFIGKCNPIERDTIRNLMKVHISLENQTLKTASLKKDMVIYTVKDVQIDNGFVLPKHSTCKIVELPDENAISVIKFFVETLGHDVDDKHAGLHKITAPTNGGSDNSWHCDRENAFDDAFIAK